MNEDEKLVDMQRFFDQEKISFSVVRDSKQALVAAMKVETMPTSFLLDRSGAIRFYAQWISRG